MIDEKRWGILYCPKSGALRPGKRWEKIEQILREKDIAFDFVQSESTGSVERLVKMFVNNGYRTIVIVGGDSALNDAVNVLMDTDADVRNEIVLGVVPNGLINDFAHFWNIRENEEERCIEWIAKRRVRKIDLGCVRYHNKQGDACHRYFLNCVNIGLVASIMKLRKQTRRIFGMRSLSFFSSFLMMLFQRMEYHMHLKINSDEVKRKVMTVCIGNASGYGQTPNAVPYNGLLDVSVVYHPEMMQLLEGINLFLRGKFLNHRSVHPYRTQRVDIESIGQAMVSVDGRLIKRPKGTFSVNVEQEVINFLIPD